MKLTRPARTAVTTIRDEMDRLFDSFAGPSFFAPATQVLDAMWSPALDFSEDKDEFVARLEVPGIPKENLDVSVEGRTLTVSGRRDFEKEEKAEDYFWREREEGRFVRTVQLPAPVNAAKVDATVTDGVMTIRLPKAAPAVANRIPVK